MVNLMVRRGALPASLLLLIFFSGPGYPQAKRDLPPLQPPAVSDPLAPPAPPIVGQAPPLKSVDELIIQLEQIKKEKAELEKREKATVLQLQERLKNQTDRLAKLGIIAPAPLPKPPEAKIDNDNRILPIDPGPGKK